MPRHVAALHPLPAHRRGDVRRLPLGTAHSSGGATALLRFSARSFSVPDQAPSAGTTISITIPAGV